MVVAVRRTVTGRIMFASITRTARPGPVAPPDPWDPPPGSRRRRAPPGTRARGGLLARLGTHLNAPGTPALTRQPHAPSRSSRPHPSRFPPANCRRDRPPLAWAQRREGRMEPRGRTPGSPRVPRPLLRPKAPWRQRRRHRRELPPLPSVAATTQRHLRVHRGSENRVRLKLHHRTQERRRRTEKGTWTC